MSPQAKQDKAFEEEVLRLSGADDDADQLIADRWRTSALPAAAISRNCPAIAQRFAADVWKETSLQLRALRHRQAEKPLGAK